MKLLSVVFISALAFAAVNAGCPNGWELHESDCYYNSNEIFRNWNDAVNFCVAINGTLTSVKTQAEYDFLKILAANASPLYPIWIGLHRDPSVSSYPRWIWLDGSSANSSFFNTNPIEVDGCISWRTLSTNNGFETISCLFDQPFICKTAASV
uniref:C-type lectin domain-containing protein n=1 Tax=Panagrolaimus sp. ES5 TaxID=591445 RepID=A0AC34FT17_9BILA